MKRLLVMLVASLTLALAFATGSALAGNVLTRDASGSPIQTATQSNSGSNEAKQSATSIPIVVSGPNVAALNGGDVKQNSGNDVDSSASNYAKQSNTQSNDADQSQSVERNGKRCCKPKTQRCRPCSNPCARSRD